MQLYFIDKLLQLKEKEQNEYLTDLLFIAQKKGKKVWITPEKNVHIWLREGLLDQYK